VPLPRYGVGIINDETLKDATIQNVIDDLLKFAHTAIQSDRGKPQDSKRYVHGSRHDAVPLYYLRPDTSGDLCIPEKIALAVHTSGHRDGYRFRIAQPSTREFPNGYTYNKENLAINAMKNDFTPRWEGAPTFTT